MPNFELFSYAYLSDGFSRSVGTFLVGSSYIFSYSFLLFPVSLNERAFDFAGINFSNSVMLYASRGVLS